MREAVCDFTAQIVDVLYAVTIILRDCRTIWLRPLTLVACFAMLLITVSPQLYAQVAPPLLHQTNLYTLLPDGTKSLSLMLNQPIGIDFEFDVGVCRGCGTFDGSNGLMYGYYLFKAQWPGASSVSTFGNTGCQWWDGGQPIESGYYTSYAYFSTPGTKSVTFSVTPCTAGALGASKTVTFKIGPGLVDPGAAALLPGSTKVISTPDDVVLNSRPIMGVSADGVSLALLEIPMANVGDSVTVNVINDINAQSSSPGEDGAVGLPGDAAYSSSSIIASAINTNSQGPMAFVAYQAPVDFARLGAGGGYKLGTCGAQQNISDDQLICRTVSLQIQITSGGNTSTQTIPVTIVRPPVILVHGLWGEKEDWNKFSPLYTPAQHDFRFFVQPVNYNRPYPQPLRSLDPTNWAPNKILTIKYNSLGFEENAKLIGPDIRSFIQTFKQGVNPANVAVAAIQADIVAHSMGGVITRTLVYLPNYLDPDTLQQGIVHKLITIDTPHLGSELAAMLLQDQNYCTRGLFASVGMVSANVVTTKNGQRVYGAVGDLQAGSIALSNIALPGVHKLPTALIAGVSTSGNFPQDCVLCTLNLLGDACGSDPLMQYIFQGVWPQVFNGADSDSIVSVTSQLNNLGTGAGTEFRGVIHSSGIETLNFVGPTVLDSGQVPNQVILFLNTPVTQSLFNPLNP